MLCFVFKIKRHDTKDINEGTDIWLELYKEVEIFFEGDWRFGWEHMEVTCAGEELDIRVGYVCGEGDVYWVNIIKVAIVLILTKDNKKVNIKVVLHLDSTNKVQLEIKINKRF